MNHNAGGYMAQSQQGFPKATSLRLSDFRTSGLPDFTEPKAR
jgi:hypothetical protein